MIKIDDELLKKLDRKDIDKNYHLEEVAKFSKNYLHAIVTHIDNLYNTYDEEVVNAMIEYVQFEKIEEKRRAS